MMFVLLTDTCHFNNQTMPLVISYHSGYCQYINNKVCIYVSSGRHFQMEVVTFPMVTLAPHLKVVRTTPCPIIPSNPWDPGNLLNQEDQRGQLL